MSLKAILIIAVSIPVLYVVSVIIYGSATRYKPEKIEYLERHNARPPNMIQDSSFSIMTWNIGFAGLGKESDFFYDGGKQVRQSEEVVRKNLDGIKHILLENPCDFICLQEVDTFSRRSHYIHQSEFISNFLPNYEYTFSTNFKVNYVPLPLFKPLGKINSGLMTLSKLPSTYPERHRYDSKGKWPNRIFMLNRCFSKRHIPLISGKDLVIINTHNSAYDPDGTMKKAELDKLIPYADSLYQKGNHVVIAGDWNRCPPDYQTKGREKEFNETKFDSSTLPEGWQWISDLDTPSNRKLNQVFDKEISYTSVIDFFAISPNVSPKQITTTKTNFEFSDHQPVILKFQLD